MMKLCIVILSLALQCGASPIYYLATGQTGAQTQIDVSHTSSWLMTPGINFDFGGGLFTMKDGSSTIDDVTLALYQGIDAGGSLLGSLNLTHSTFCAPPVGNCGQFAPHPFFFGAPISLVPGTTYFASLTSAASNVQSLAYFIKNDSFFISDQSGIQIQPQPVTFGTPSSPIPEPRSLALLGIGLGLVWGLKLAKA